MAIETPLMPDWVGNPRAFALAWVMPSVAMVATVIAALFVAGFAASPAMTVIWIGALISMGVACLANASRCGRVHCIFTGPFFLLMALVTGLHGFQIVPLGDHGWVWLGMTITAGGIALWWLPERVWGKFAARRARR